MTNNETKTQKTNNKNNKMKAFGLGIGLGLGIPLLALTTSTIVLGVTKNNNGGTGGTDDGGYSETKWVKYTKSENFSKVDEITPKMMEMISNNVISYEPDKDYSNSSIYNKNLIADANNNVLSNPNIDKIAESAIGLLGYIGINM